MTNARKVSPRELENSVAWNGRIEKEILKAIKAHANANRRTIIGQINFALDEWLKNYAPGDVTAVHVTERTVTKRTAPPVIPAGGSQPPHRIQQLAAGAATRNPPVAPDVLKDIAESEEGWEGTDTKVLAGTKVTSG